MARTRRPIRRPRKKTNPVPAILGFLVFAGALVYTGVVVVNWQKASNRAIQEYRQALARVEAAAEHRKAAILERRQTLKTHLKQLQAEDLALKQQVQATERQLAKTREELAEKAAKQAQLTQKVDLQVEDKLLVGEGVDELLTRVSDLKKEKNSLLNRFKTAYTELKTELKQLANQGDPDRMRMFFFTNRATAFGPAAGFFAADFYYRKNQTRDAQNLYESILKQFPDSAYADTCRTRIADIKARLPYDIYSTPGFHPYKVPDSLDFGSW